MKEFLIDIDKLINNSDNLYAHIKENRKENIIEHSKNVISVFEYFDKEYSILSKLDASFSKFKYSTNKEQNISLSKEAIALIKTIFVNAIYIHDIGKINPKFQQIKMQNELNIHNLDGFINNNITESYHSPISTMIYIALFNDKINKLIQEKRERNVLKYLLLCFSNTIKCHHGELISLNNSLNESELNRYISHFDVVDNKYFYFYNNSPKFCNSITKVIPFLDKNQYKFDNMTIYIWTKLLFSFLVSSDFIATYCFYNDISVSSFEFNNKLDVEKVRNKFKESSIMKGVESYAKDKNYFRANNLPLINELRTDISLECRKNITKYKNERIFMIESPTGSGKTINSISCALELLDYVKKIVYVFPVNTLSNQTKSVLDGLFKNVTSFQEINSTASLPSSIDYEKVLLDRQLLNYESILTSSVNLFSILFGTSREGSMGLISLFNSVIILDEIQNYKNAIWKESIEFLYKISEVMNIKIILMSATLPNLEKLIGFRNDKFIHLISNPSKYYNNDLFKNRVTICNDLLNKRDISFNYLVRHIEEEVKKRDSIEKTKSKVIVEFITKKSCLEFYDEATSILKDFTIYHLDSNTNNIKKEAIIRELNEKNNKNILLCTTQVVEAGIDIDLDLGYKDAVFPDVDEQFLGRINRSSKKKNCKAFFFNYDNEYMVYKNDYRLGANIKNNKYFDILIKKDFKEFYENLVFYKLNKFKNKSVLSDYIEFDKAIFNQDFNKIYEYMRLIDTEKFSIFIPFKTNGLDGEKVWKEYISLINDKNMGYAERRIKLMNIRKELNCFTFSLYGEGLELMEREYGYYYIENWQRYIINDRFNQDLFMNDYKILPSAKNRKL